MFQKNSIGVSVPWMIVSNVPELDGGPTKEQKNKKQPEIVQEAATEYYPGV